MTLSTQVCEAIAGLDPAHLPAEAMEAARLALLDATGVMLAASGLSPETMPFRALAAATGGPCAVLGTASRTTAAMAALANGAMAHALDFEDAFDRAPGHPNASLVPALIALAQAEGPVDGSLPPWRWAATCPAALAWPCASRWKRAAGIRRRSWQALARQWARRSCWGWTPPAPAMPCR